MPPLAAHRLATRHRLPGCQAVGARGPACLSRAGGPEPGRHRRDWGWDGGAGLRRGAAAFLGAAGSVARGRHEQVSLTAARCSSGGHPRDEATLLRTLKATNLRPNSGGGRERSYLGIGRFLGRRGFHHARRVATFAPVKTRPGAREDAAARERRLADGLPRLRWMTILTYSQRQAPRSVRRPTPGL
jgi:hypothetical protein